MFVYFNIYNLSIFTNILSNNFIFYQFFGVGDIGSLFPYHSFDFVSIFIYFHLFFG